MLTDPALGGINNSQSSKENTGSKKKGRKNGKGKKGAKQEETKIIQDIEQQGEFGFKKLSLNELIDVTCPEEEDPYDMHIDEVLAEVKLQESSMTNLMPPTNYNTKLTDPTLGKRMAKIYGNHNEERTMDEEKLEPASKKKIEDFGMGTHYHNTDAFGGYKSHM